MTLIPATPSLLVLIVAVLYANAGEIANIKAINKRQAATGDACKAIELFAGQVSETCIDAAAAEIERNITTSFCGPVCDTLYAVHLLCYGKNVTDSYYSSYCINGYNGSTNVHVIDYTADPNTCIAVAGPKCLQDLLFSATYKNNTAYATTYCSRDCAALADPAISCTGKAITDAKYKALCGTNNSGAASDVSIGYAIAAVSLVAAIFS